MKTLAALLLALLLALPAAVRAETARAETVKVRSGDHGSFDRLALALPAPVAWQMGRDGQAYVLRLAAPDLVLDTADIYPRIARTRLVNVTSPRPGELRLDLGCRCRARAYELRPGLLVVDVSNGAPSPASPFEAPLPSLGPATWPGMTERPAASDDDTAIYWRGVLDQPQPARGTEVAQNVAVGQAREELLSELARAVAQGLVEVEGDLDGDLGGGETPLASPLLTAQTVMDRDLGGVRPIPTARACLSDARVDLGSWGDGRPFSRQIGEARRSLLGEFDKPSRPDITRLVRLYVHFGLGTEVRAMIRAFPGTVEDEGVALSLAAILESDPATESRDDLASDGDLAGMAGCDGQVSLWSFLSDPPLGAARDIARGSILRTFSALPGDLRRLVGPELSNRFLRRDDAEAARTVAEAMARAPGPASPGEVLTDARIATATGKTPDARLETVAETDTPEAAEALLLLIENRLARGEPIGADLATSAGALAFERRDSPLAPRLERAHVLALGSAGAFEAAYEVLDGLPPAQIAPGTRSELLGQLARTGTDDSVLRYALRADGVPMDAGADVLADVGARLLDLGFASEARALLERLRAEGVDPFLAIRAALADRDPRDALRRLAGRSEPEAGRLRAEALTQLGDFAAAQVAWRDAGQTQAEARSAWRAGDWAVIRAVGEPQEKAVAAFVAPPPAPAPVLSPSTDEALASAGPVSPSSAPSQEPDGILAQNRTLVAEATTARAALEALLAAHPMPEG